MHILEHRFLWGIRSKQQLTLFTFNASANCCAPLSVIWLPILNCWSTYCKDERGDQNCNRNVSDDHFEYQSFSDLFLEILSFKYFSYHRLSVENSWTRKRGSWLEFSVNGMVQKTVHQGYKLSLPRKTRLCTIFASSYHFHINKTE